MNATPGAVEIPIVDLHRSDAAARLDETLERFGFVQVVGHDIDLDLVAALWRAMDGYFSLPTETKAGHIVPEPLSNRGYRRRGSEALAYSLGQSSPPDLFESFNLGHDDRNQDDEPLLAANRWPDEPVDFRRATSDWLAAMATLCHRLDELLGPIANIDDLASIATRGPDTMACIRYERRADESVPATGQMRMGAHTDYTLFSVLCADPMPGLEILGPDGRWHGVTPAPGALLVNVGDLLAIATDDRWRSTLHRVPIPTADVTETTRRSVAYFHYPDLDATIRPPASSEYQPVTVRDHLAQRLIGPKEHRPSDANATTAGRTLR